ncbi:hypothetical protein RFI_21345, partial [Reticulomyxa filosa]
IAQTQNNLVATLQTKVAHSRFQLKEAKDQYISAVSHYRGLCCVMNCLYYCCYCCFFFFNRFNNTHIRKHGIFFFFFSLHCRNVNKKNVEQGQLNSRHQITKKRTEVERAKMFHKLLNVYLEVQHTMIHQSMQKIETIKAHISNLNPQTDNILFVEKFRSYAQKPPLPDALLDPDDSGKEERNNQAMP